MVTTVTEFLVIPFHSPKHRRNVSLTEGIWDPFIQQILIVLSKICTIKTPFLRELIMKTFKELQFSTSPFRKTIFNFHFLFQ